MIVTSHHFSFDEIDKDEMGGHVATCERGEVCTMFWWGYLKERGHLQELSVDGRIILRCVLKKLNGGVD